MLEDFKLKVFMTVAAERSFTKAAAVLGISQPAVSQNISELERLLDIKLFDRLRGEVAITEQGRIFQAHASGILGSYENMNRLFCNPRINKRPSAMPVRIFVSPLLESMLMPALKNTVHVLRPSLSLEFIDSAENAHVRILALTEKKGTDLSIRVDVQSDDILIASFFRQLVEYCI